MRVANHKRLMLICCLLLLMILISGCVSIDVHLKIKRDGSARLDSTVTVQDAMFRELVAGSIQDLRREYPDLEVAVRESRGETVFSLGGAVKDVDDVSDLLHALYSMGALYRTDGSTHRLEIRPAGSQLMTGFSPFSSVLRVTMPGRVTDTNGTVIDSSSVRWDLTHATQSVLWVESQDSGTALLPLLVLVVAASGVAALVWRRGSGRRAEAVTPPQTAAQARWCKVCGQKGGAGDQFCASCGDRLGDSKVQK